MGEIISPLILIVGVVVAIIAVKLLNEGIKVAISYLEARRKDEEIGLAIIYTDVIVRALEQTGGLKGLDGQAKKERAIMDLTTFAEKYKISIERGEIDSIIESTVQKLGDNNDK